MARRRTYTDQQLADAIRTSTSWRGVLRELGLLATSGSAMRSARSYADRLGLDHSHFVGQRKWTPDSLRSAVEAASSWEEAGEIVGILSPAGVSNLRGHALRLGIPTAHLDGPRAVAEPPGPATLVPDLRHLRHAGEMIAAAWYQLSGWDVVLPLGQPRYDLLVEDDQETRKVQVKTTTTRIGHSWTVALSKSQGGHRTYTPDEIDEFFIVDGDLHCYLIPLAAVGGLQAIQLSRYAEYRVHSPLALPSKA